MEAGIISIHTIVRITLPVFHAFTKGTADKLSLYSLVVLCLLCVEALRPVTKRLLIIVLWAHVYVAPPRVGLSC